MPRTAQWSSSRLDLTVAEIGVVRNRVTQARFTSRSRFFLILTATFQRSQGAEDFFASGTL